MANCRSCGKEIVWLKHHETEKVNPIERDPHPDGNIVPNFENGIYRMATGNEKEIAKYHGKNIYISHFSTCPDADTFRNKGQ